MAVVLFSGNVNPAMRITQSGDLDRRYASTQAIEKMIDKKVNQAFDDFVNSLNEDSPDDNTETSGGKKKKKINWRTSTQGLMILSRVALSTTTGLAEAEASTDKVATQKHAFHDAVSLTTMAIGTLGGPWGALIASALNTAYTIWGTAISNGIQRSGDYSRLQYNYTNMDYQKYGTYAFNNTSGEWINQDANKVRAKVLNKNASV